MNNEAIEKLRSALSNPDQVMTTPGDLLYWGSDWTKEFAASPVAICFPKSPQEVSRLVSVCQSNGLKIVPSGGRTGLAAGATASNGEVVISLTKMNRILRIDPISLVIEVEAGVTTEQVQQAAKEAGVFFALDLAAKGSSQIGGNIATNAGGLKFIRYGGMREQVLGLECVMADGRILDCNNELRKNNTGYDLKQLLIGSEGTLGIITKATLRLLPAPRTHSLMCLGVNHFADLLTTLGTCQRQHLNLTAFEFFSRDAHEKVLAHFPNVRSPFSERYPYYALIECELEHDGSSQLHQLFETLFSEETVADGLIADSTEQFGELWQLRELITEAIAATSLVRKNDVSFGLSELNGFVNNLQTMMQKHTSQIDMLLFGHIGDGNIHINYVSPKTNDQADFFQTVRDIEHEVMALVGKHHGSVSAEHGIGLIKKDDLAITKSALEIELMRAIKQVFDPNCLLNPGKIFDTPSDQTL